MKQEIIDKFIDYFGDERVDILTDYILIHYPEVIISNENDLTHLMRDLFVRVSFKNDIYDKFEILRTTFTEIEHNKNYCHSHVSGLPSTFSVSCLGSGPINKTILSLKTDSNNLFLWDLFIVELDKYIRTESLDGGPYKKISELVSSKKIIQVYESLFTNELYIDPSHTDLINNFLNHFSRESIYKQIKVVYDTNCFKIGLSYPESVKIITKIFLEWLIQENIEITQSDKNKLFINGLYKTVSIETYKEQIRNNNESSKVLLIFKGNNIYKRIISIEEDIDKQVCILNLNIVDYILSILLINYNLKNELNDKRITII